jgi:hypothetical protein
MCTRQDTVQHCTPRPLSPGWQDLLADCRSLDHVLDPILNTIPYTFRVCEKSEIHPYILRCSNSNKSLYAHLIEFLITF